MGLFDSILKIAAPVAGFALGGPLGGAIGGAVSSGISGAQSQSKADKLNKQALALKQQQYNEMAPARSRLMALLNNPNSFSSKAPDLSADFADPGNPYARPISRLAEPLLNPPTTATPTAPVPQRPDVSRLVKMMKQPRGMYT